MTNDLENPPLFGGSAGEPVAEVDPQDLKALWHLGRDIQARNPGRNVATGFDQMKAVCQPGANAHAVWYRSSMIWLLNQFAQGQLAPWVKDDQVSDAVFQTMATIPMEWVGHTERVGLPFDVEEFFRQLREDGVQNG
jgi:hypothetical protein